jgi:hypothetical protein
MTFRVRQGPMFRVRACAGRAVGNRPRTSVTHPEYRRTTHRTQRRVCVCVSHEVLAQNWNTLVRPGTKTPQRHPSSRTRHTCNLKIEIERERERLGEGDCAGPPGQQDTLLRLSILSTVQCAPPVSSTLHGLPIVHARDLPTKLSTRATKGPAYFQNTPPSQWNV